MKDVSKGNSYIIVIFDIIIDGPTIKTDTIYALNNLYVKSGSINLIGRIRVINAYFNGGEVKFLFTIYKFI